MAKAKYEVSKLNNETRKYTIMIMIEKIKNKIVDLAFKRIMRYKEKAADQMYIKKTRASYAKLKNQKKLSQEQISEIQDFFRNTLGHTVPVDWHQYFYSRTGIYSKLYIPSSEYKNHIIGKLNVYPFHLAYNDKNMTDITLPNTHQPKVFLKNMCGYFYFEGKPVTKDEALDLCRDLGEVIIKPSLTGRGVGVKKASIANGKIDGGSQSLSDLLKEYNADYLIQKVIIQHAGMSALNPSSINTIRVVTYRSGMEINAVYTVIRIGRKGMNIDNESAGGISAIIRPDGTIGKYAYGAPGVDKIEFTDSGIRLEGYKVPSFDKAIELVKFSHMQLPYFNLIGWDIAIEEDGSPIMIELNLNPDLSQSANGPAFGGYTEKILKDAMSRKNTWTPLTTKIMNKRNYTK